MKNLLQKSLKPLTYYAFIIFAISIPVYIVVVEWIWLKELDENNELIAQRIENEFNDQKISNQKLKESITFWNEIQPISKIEPAIIPLKNDSVYSIYRQNPYLKKKSIDRFRGYVTTIKINNKDYLLTIETNMEESEETIGYIAGVTLIFFLILIVGFWILNKKHAQKLWEPFRDTLEKLKSFQLNKHHQITFLSTDIVEFQELNKALNTLLQHNIATFKSQKEFTENASHELQTPIAIIKNKLDVLLQDKSLTNKQYNTIEEINKTLSRMTRINKNLLLLAKIENRQFEDVEKFYISDLLKKSIFELEDFIVEKKLIVETNLNNNVPIEANKVLTEILINNLLLNTFRYSDHKSVITITSTNEEFSIANKGNFPLDEEFLFNRFKKMSAESNGSGLGLAIAKEICNNNSWKLEYEFKNHTHFFVVIY